MGNIVSACLASLIGSRRSVASQARYMTFWAAELGSSSLAWSNSPAIIPSMPRRSGSEGVALI
ncbi:hypothetical protein [Acidiphilium sp. 37-64-53]|uniref:hypothetical protein n=1 Tax=Acidiphilium sp. 37-64-53 TaxID=1970299 RepID=UPI002580770B|nr:hypothetical protein [Acidiphilium sp. 37-64-53]